MLEVPMYAEPLKSDCTVAFTRIILLEIITHSDDGR